MFTNREEPGEGRTLIHASVTENQNKKDFLRYHGFGCSQVMVGINKGNVETQAR